MRYLETAALTISNFAGADGAPVLEVPHHHRHVVLGKLHISKLATGRNKLYGAAVSFDRFVRMSFLKLNPI